MIKNEDRKAAKAGIWYTIVNFISKGAIFLTTPFFTRLMSTEEVGAYSNISSWVSVLLPLITFDMGVTLAVARFDYKDEFDKYCSSAMAYGTATGLLFYAIVALNINFFSELFSIEPYAIHLMFIYMLTYTGLSFFQARNLYNYRYKTSALVTLISLVLSIGVSLLFTLSFENRVFGRALGHFGVYTLISLGLFIFLLTKGGFSLKYFKYAVKLSFPMIWHTMSMHLLTSGDRIVIIKYLGNSPNAMYSVAYTCAHVVSILYHSMNSAWSPWSTAMMNRDEKEKLRATSRIYVGGFAICVFLLILVCPEFLLIMGGKKYLESKMVIPPVMVAVVCQFVYSLYINAEFYLKKQTRIAAGTIFASLLNLGLNVIFVPRYGYVAAAYTTLFGYFCLFIFHFVSLKLLGKADWYDEKFNFIVIVVMMALIPFFNFLYQHTVIRYSFIGVTACVVLYFTYKYRAKLIEIVKSFLKKENKQK